MLETGYRRLETRAAHSNRRTGLKPGVRPSVSGSQHSYPTHASPSLSQSGVSRTLATTVASTTRTAVRTLPP